MNNERPHCTSCNEPINIKNISPVSFWYCEPCQNTMPSTPLPFDENLPVTFNINCLMCRGEGTLSPPKLWNKTPDICPTCDGVGIVPITIRPDDKPTSPIYDAVSGVGKVLNSDNTSTIFIPNADVNGIRLDVNKKYRVTITEVTGGDE